MITSNYDPNFPFPKPKPITADDGIETPSVDEPKKSLFDNLSNQIKSIYNPRLSKASKKTATDNQAIIGDDSGDSEDSIAPKKELQTADVLSMGTGLVSLLASDAGKDASNDKEVGANALNQAMGGAQLGMQVGSFMGPQGAAIGAAGGAVVFGAKALLSGASGKRAAAKARNDKMNAMYTKSVADRETEQRMQEGQDRIDASKALYKAQLGIIK